MRILSIPLDLGGHDPLLTCSSRAETHITDLRSTCKPITKADCRPCRMPYIPTVHKAINRTSGQDIHMMSGKVDISDGPCVCVQDMFDGRPSVPHVEIPQKRLLV